MEQKEPPADAQEEEEAPGIFPYVIYQSVNLIPDILTHSLRGDTLLWIGFKQPVHSGHKLYLHCRECVVTKVTVNSAPARWALLNPLKHVGQYGKETSSATFNADELDIEYRAALEITRSGELEIQIPRLQADRNGRGGRGLTAPAALPKGSPADIVARFEKLRLSLGALAGAAGIPQPGGLSTGMGAYGGMSMGTHTSPHHSAPGSVRGEYSAAASEGQELGVYLVQVRIEYKVNPRGQGQGQAGCVFRKPPPLEALFRASVDPAARRAGVAAGGGGRAAAQSAQALNAAVAVYSASFAQSVRDPDGVRCWLPCLDSLDQRAVFDLTITAPRTWRVASVGKKVSTYMLEEPSSQSLRPALKVSRFVTPSRIPASAVGFYLGRVETYKMGLYKTRARLWVSMGLADFGGKSQSRAGKAKRRAEATSPSRSSGALSDSDFSEDEEEEEEEVEEEEVWGVGDSVSVAPISRQMDSRYARCKRTLTDAGAAAAASAGVDAGQEGTGKPTEAPPTKRQRSYSLPDDTDPTDPPAFGAFPPPAALAQAQARPYSHAHTRGRGGGGGAGVGAGGCVDADELPAVSPVSSRLYADSVHHSTLGLDIALRLVHKFTGRCPDYEEIVIVFVPALGADFVASDGLLLLDASLLHDARMVWRETSAHLTLLQGYLYSWLSSALPVDALTEFALHGAVGYLLNFYTEEVFGEDDGRYRYQKTLDTVLQLEKMGFGMPLSSFYPEMWEGFGPQFGVYLRAKSAVLFQLVESRIGGREVMRGMLKQMIKSPLVYPTQRAFKGAAREATSPFHNVGSASPAIIDHAVSNAVRARAVGAVDRDRANSEGWSPHSGNQSPVSQSMQMSPYSGCLSPTGRYSPQNVSPYPYSHSYYGRESERGGLEEGSVGNMSPHSLQSPYNHLSPYPYGNISPWGGGISPAWGLGGGQGHMSPYAAAAAAGRVGGGVGGGVSPYPYSYTYSPSRYELAEAHSPVVGVLKDQESQERSQEKQVEELGEVGEAEVGGKEKGEGTGEGKGEGEGKEEGEG
ncbi:hypothetical protein B484DRAFT_416169, partial [Ochromonadaceae sp. CCMP2298]